MTNKADDVDFFADHFGIPAFKSAMLVTDDEDEAHELTAQRLRRERLRHPYPDGAPIPASSEDQPVKNNGGLQKPVLNEKNKTERAGP